MSDVLRRPPMQGAPPMGPRPQMGGNPMQAQESMANPTDLAAKMSRGAIRPDMTIREFYQQMGIDVDGPLSQLKDAMGDQLTKASPINKIQAMGGGQAGAPPAPPQGGGGLADIMAKMRR